MEKITHRLIFATAMFCSSMAFALTEEVHVLGTPITYEYMSFGEWSKQPQEITGGGHAQIMGSQYSQYRAKLAKNAYCSKITAEHSDCRTAVFDTNAAAVTQCTQLKSYTTTAQVGADGKLVNGNVAITYTFDNKDDCYRVTDAFKEAALSSCDSKLANLKAQTAKHGFCQ